MAHKKAGGSSRNGRDSAGTAPRREAVRRRDRARRQHPRPPARHQVAPGRRRRPRQGPHDLRPHRRHRRLPDQSQRPHLRIGQPDWRPQNSRLPTSIAGVTSTRRDHRFRGGDGTPSPLFLALVGGCHAATRRGRVRATASLDPHAAADSEAAGRRRTAGPWPRSRPIRGGGEPGRRPRALAGGGDPSPSSNGGDGRDRRLRGFGAIGRRPLGRDRDLGSVSRTGGPRLRHRSDAGDDRPRLRRRAHSRSLWCSNRASNARARRVIEKCGFQFRGTGMVRSPTLFGAFPVERFVLERRNWASLKAWGAPAARHDEAARDNAA